MVNKSDFTAEEWKQILIAPQMASLVVMLASPSGPAGAVQEMIASSKLIAEAIKTATGNALIDAVAADYKERIERKEQLQQPAMSKDAKEAKAQGLQACRDLAALLSHKVGAEAEGYKRWVYQAAQNSSEAAKEGGFLGIGGERVSKAEAAALQEIAEALGIAA